MPDWKWSGICLLFLTAEVHYLLYFVASLHVLLFCRDCRIDLHGSTFLCLGFLPLVIHHLLLSQMLNCCLISIIGVPDVYRGSMCQREYDNLIFVACFSLCSAWYSMPKSHRVKACHINSTGCFRSHRMLLQGLTSRPYSGGQARLTQ